MPDLLRQSPTVIIATCGGPIRRPDRVFAMSRDGCFPVHRLMRRVSPRTQTPVPATVLILAVGVALRVSATGRRVAEADDGVHDPSGDHLRRDGRPVPTGCAVGWTARRAPLTSGGSRCRSRSVCWCGHSCPWSCRCRRPKRRVSRPGTRRARDPRPDRPGVSCVMRGRRARQVTTVPPLTAFGAGRLFISTQSLPVGVPHCRMAGSEPLLSNVQVIS
jgi:hypothetical protein